MRSFRNLIYPLPSVVWALLLLSVGAMTILFIVIVHVYKGLPGEGLVRPGVTWKDICLKTICTLTEPEQISYFPTWSTGKLVNMSMFYAILKC